MIIFLYKLKNSNTILIIFVKFCGESYSIIIKMSIELRLNSKKTLFSLDKLPDSCNHLKMALINLFDFPEEVTEKDLNLFFLDEEADKISLKSSEDFEALKKEHKKVILIELDPMKLIHKPGSTAILPLILDEGHSFEALEPTIRNILFKKLKEILPVISEKLETIYKQKYQFQSQSRPLADQETQTTCFKQISAEIQTFEEEKVRISEESQTSEAKKIVAMAGVQTFLEKKDAEVQKSRKKQVETEMQTEKWMKLAEAGSQTEIIPKEEFKSPEKPPKILEKKPNPIKSPEKIDEMARIDLLMLEFLQKTITVKDDNIKVRLVVQNNGEAIFSKGNLGLKIPEKYFIYGENKVLDEMGPQEIREIIYQIKNPGADGRYGGFLDIYLRETGSVLKSFPFEFEVKEDLFAGYKKEIVEKTMEVMDCLGIKDDEIVKRVLNYFAKNEEADVNAAVNVFIEGGI